MVVEVAPQQLLTVFKVARRLGTSEELVRRLIRQGLLPAIRIGPQWRLELDDVMAFIAARKVGR